MDIYVFGNQLAPCDHLPFDLLPSLENLFPMHRFIVSDPNEDLLPPLDQPWIIIDTVVGIADVTVFTSVETFAMSPQISPHDYDLGFHLKLLQKIGQLREIAIIGIPPQLSQQTALEKVKKAISDISMVGLAEAKQETV